MKKEKNIIWKEIDGTGGAYSVSNTGLVRSNYRVMVRSERHSQRVFEKQLSMQRTTAGYNTVGIRGKTLLVSRLVAQAFLPNPENKAEVNHINGVTYDNRVENLEWTTRSENLLHSYRVLGRKSARLGVVGVLHHASKRIAITDLGGRIVAVAGSQRQAAKLINGSQGTLWSSLNGKIGAYKGFKYKELTMEEYTKQKEICERRTADHLRLLRIQFESCETKAQQKDVLSLAMSFYPNEQSTLEMKNDLQYSDKPKF